jgi:tetratricopeptide (TPR) repeat protein
MSRPYATLLFLIAMAIALPAAAQTGRVTGAVLDPTGKPVKGAIIKAINKDAAPSELTSTTDNKGRFALIGLRAGIWTFVAEAPGYEPSTGTAPIRSATLGPPLRFVIQRTPEPIPGALPKDILEQLDAANALRAQGRYDQALSVYQAIQAKNPKVSSLSGVVGDVLRTQAVNASDDATRLALYARAATAYEDASKADPSSERLQLDLGLAQVSAGQVDDGVRTLQALVASSPNSAAGKDAAARLLELRR